MSEYLYFFFNILFLTVLLALSCNLLKGFIILQTADAGGLGEQ
jgi:hypothetical protein